MSTTDEENTENVETDAPEAEATDTAAETETEVSTDETAETVEALEEEAPAEAAAEEEVVAAPEEAATTDAGHDDDHGHSETHFPMDEGETFERQLVTEYSDGGHEFDPPMAKGIMLFTVALAVMCVLAGVALMQLHLAERNSMTAEQAAKIPKDLVQQREMNAKELTLARKHEGRNTVTVPISEAKKDLLANSAKLKAFVNPPQPPRPQAAPTKK